MADNYVTPFGLRDALSVPLQVPLLWELSSCTYLILCRRSTSTPGDSRIAITRKLVVALALIILMAWLPYLLTYWPGYIFGDSTASIDQALGILPLSNHHPVAFTLLVKACLWIGIAVSGDLTVGCALFSIFQMCVMSLCLSYLSVWVASHARLGRLPLAAIVALFALTPYVANYSIAMWKDPLFSCALIMFTLCLANQVLYIRSTEGTCKKPHPWSIGMCAAAMIALRNNGIYISLLEVGVLAIALVVLWRRRQGTATKPNFTKAALPVAFLAAITLCGYLVMGPLFTSLGLNTDGTVESAGIPVNQMARVVATGGEMTESDQSYMARLFPLDKYGDAYAPCLIDDLKWNPDFDASVLENDLLAHWLSMGLRNPVTYLESWELQTAGFWAFGIKGGIPYVNISMGVPRNNSADGLAQLTAYGINARNLLPDAARIVFPQEEWSIPEGWVLWLIVFVCICLASRKKSAWLSVFAPSLALFGTLFLASPIIYWPRYALACQLLLPLYLSLPRIASVAEGGSSPRH